MQIRRAGRWRNRETTSVLRNQAPSQFTLSQGLFRSRISALSISRPDVYIRANRQPVSGIIAANALTVGFGLTMIWFTCREKSPPPARARSWLTPPFRISVHLSFPPTSELFQEKVMKQARTDAVLEAGAGAAEIAGAMPEN